MFYEMKITFIVFMDWYLGTNIIKGRRNNSILTVHFFIYKFYMSLYKTKYVYNTLLILLVRLIV